MSEFIFTMVLVGIGAVIGSVVTEDHVNMPARTAIKKCEETLPRNQHCVIQYIAVPEEKK